jgi:hypothetical protein
MEARARVDRSLSRLYGRLGSRRSIAAADSPHATELPPYMCETRGRVPVAVVRKTGARSR